MVTPLSGTLTRRNHMRTKLRHITAVSGTVAIIVATLALEFDIKALDADKNEGNSEATHAEFAAIAAGSYHTVVLRTDGSVVAWGDNNYGQTDVPNGLKDMTAVAAGSRHTVALRTDGSVVAWGDNRFRRTDVPDGLKDVTAIAAGRGHTVALRTDGSVVAWGYNDLGLSDVGS